MENQNKNHLSYFHNIVQNPKKHEKTKKKEATFFSSLLFSLIIVLVCCGSLRIIEDFIIENSNEKYLPNQLNPFHLSVAKAEKAKNRAAFLVQSHKHVRIVPNKGFTFIVKFKNTGNKTWRKNHVYLKSLTTGVKFRHEFWPDPFFPGSLSEEKIEPGQVATFKFAVQAPKKYGSYFGDFVLAEDNVMIRNGKISISMDVTADPENVPKKRPEKNKTKNLNSKKSEPAPQKTKKSKTDSPPAVEINSLGPLLKVGLYHSEESFDIKNEKNWKLLDGNNNLLMKVKADQIISLDYDESNSNYTYTVSGQKKNSSSYFKLDDINDGLWIITNYTDSPSWNTKINYNDFKGDLEIRYNSSRDRTWIINELPMEEYLKGISETSNGSPIEYLKTMTVAARTYAYYHYTKGTKHGHEYFHVDARYDQVYKGYTASIIWKDLKKAIEQTNGIIATYEGRPIVAAYFSRSDGRTRSFKEVWYNDVPYLVSVPCPYSKGKELWGHGVGIDAYDAYHRAAEENATYDEILKYYYTGISLEKVW